MEDNYKLENYERFFGEFKEHGAHWDKIEKRTANGANRSHPSCCQCHYDYRARTGG